MKFWWVNNKKTYSHEVPGGYIWSPKTQKDGRFSQFYDNMKRVQPGDLVFSYANAKVHDVGVVVSTAKEAQKPQEFGLAGEEWATDGWLVPVDFIATPHPLRPKRKFKEIKQMLPAKYAPLDKNGEGNQGAYLCEISYELASYLLKETGGPVFQEQMLSEAKSTIDLSEEQKELESLASDDELSPTEKDQLSKARIGQGQFRRAVLKTEKRCRVTGLSELRHLRASHTKPWKVSSNSERLDGNNGLMLAVHIDHLYDKGFISFSDDGELMVSSDLSAKARTSFNILEAPPKKPFNSGQKEFLKYHREHIFKP